MTLSVINSQIPEYYPTMYLDGYTPQQILMAKRRHKILSKLPEDAILTKINASRSQTTVKERVSPSFFSWLDDFGTYAKIVAPDDVIEKYMQWQKQKLCDYASIYHVNVEDIQLEAEAEEEEQGEVVIIRPPNKK